MSSGNKIIAIDILARGCRRVARIPLVSKSLCVGKDKIGSIVFWSDRTKRSSRYADFKRCYHLDEFFRFSEQLFGPHQIKGEILSFLEFAKDEQPKLVCEIGTADGGTNFLLSQALPSVSFMLGVDLYVKKKVQLRYFSRASQRFYFINGSSYATRTVGKVERALGSRKIDLLFVDGDHSYEGVKRDFLKYRHLVREGESSLSTILSRIISVDMVLRPIVGSEESLNFGIRSNRYIPSTSLLKIMNKMV